MQARFFRSASSIPETKHARSAWPCFQLKHLLASVRSLVLRSDPVPTESLSSCCLRVACVPSSVPLKFSRIRRRSPPHHQFITPRARALYRVHLTCVLFLTRSPRERRAAVRRRDCPVGYAGRSSHQGLRARVGIPAGCGWWWSSAPIRMG